MQCIRRHLLGLALLSSLTPLLGIGTAQAQTDWPKRTIKVVVPYPAGGSADASFGVFEQERIGAELDSHASDFLRHILGGRLQPNVTHFRSVGEAVAAMKRGEVAAVMASRSELEAALGGDAAIALDTLSMPELRVNSWPLGMAVKAEHGGLEQALSGAIAELQRSGELGRIFAAHGVKQRTP